MSGKLKEFIGTCVGTALLASPFFAGGFASKTTGWSSLGTMPPTIATVGTASPLLFLGFGANSSVAPAAVIGGLGMLVGVGAFTFGSSALGYMAGGLYLKHKQKQITNSKPTTP